MVTQPATKVSYVVGYNPDKASQDKERRERLLAEAEMRLAQLLPDHGFSALLESLHSLDLLSIEDAPDI